MKVMAERTVAEVVTWAEGLAFGAGTQLGLDLTAEATVAASTTYSIAQQLLAFIRGEATDA